MSCSPNIQIRMKNKQEEFRQKRRHDEIELFFNQNRWNFIYSQHQNLTLYELFDQLNNIPSHLNLIRNIINSPELSKSDIEQFFGLFESQDSFSQESIEKINILLQYFEKENIVILEILHGLSFKSVLMTEFFIEQGLIQKLLSYLEQNKSQVRIISFFTQVAQQSISARSSLITNGIFLKIHRLIDYNDQNLIHQVLLLFDSIINIKYRIPREKFTEIIHTLNQICKTHDIISTEFPELYFSIIKHYMNGSSNHITQVLQKKSILNLIITAVFKCNSQQIQIRAAYALAQITTGSEKQNRILLEKCPDLIKNLLLLVQQDIRGQKLLFKKKLLLSLENIMTDCFHQLNEKKILGQSIAKYLRDENRFQLQCRILPILSVYFQNCSISVEQDACWIFELLQNLKDLLSSKNGEVLQETLNLILTLMDVAILDPNLLFIRDMMKALQYTQVLNYLQTIFPTTSEPFSKICEISEYLHKENIIQE